MRWPRILRRRKQGAPSLPSAPTFHHELRRILTPDGFRTVRMPVLDDPTVLDVMLPTVDTHDRGPLSGVRAVGQRPIP